MNQATARIESKKAEKILIFIKIMIAVIFLIPLVLVLKNLEYVNSLRLSHFSQFFLALFLMISFYSKLSKNKGQFIEWSEDEIQYKTKEKDGVIPINEIKTIDINIDSIIVILTNETSHTLNIQDFGDYDIRLKIKDNFGKIKTVTA